MTATTTTAACVLTLTDGHAAQAARLASTGSDLVLPLVVAGALVVLGAALVTVVVRRRRAERRQDRDGRGPALVGALLVLALGTALSLGAAPAAHATDSSSECDLISYTVDEQSSDVLIGAGDVATERLTVRNVTNGSIELAFSTTVLDDARGLAPFVRLVASCGCAERPLLDGVLAEQAAAGTSVRLAAGDAVTLAVSANTTADIRNDLQGSRVSYALVAHAMEVSA